MVSCKRPLSSNLFPQPAWKFLVILKTLGQGCPILHLEGHFSAEFSSNPN